MKKYIDTEKLKAEIERLQESNQPQNEKISEYVQGGIYGFDMALEKVVAVIGSLQQEQQSLPSNINEVAEEYAKEQLGYCDDDPDDENLCWQPLYFAFKVGAEWMAEKAKQEQPESDIEKEIDEYIEKEFGESWDGCVPVSRFDLVMMANHFYKRGHYAKEE